MSKNHQSALDLIKVNIAPRVRRCVDGNVLLEVDGRNLGQPYGVLRYSKVLVEVKPREFDELYDLILILDLQTMTERGSSMTTSMTR